MNRTIETRCFQRRVFFLEKNQIIFVVTIDITTRKLYTLVVTKIVTSKNKITGGNLK